MAPSFLSARGLGEMEPTTEQQSTFSARQMTIQQALAIAASSISLLFGLTTIYWFIRMRTMFRHSLIMLLIMSDMLKAICYFIFPIVLFARGGGERKNTQFCYASGYFLAVAIEGADYAVLIMAIHAVLGIFSTKTSLGESGLYNYRYLVYAGWLVIPGMMAGLAFINTSDAYVSQGTFCYLPVRPYWYRLALSWIPRYLILLSIAGIAIAIYLYVRHKFKDFDASSNDSYGRSSYYGPNQNQAKRASRNMQTDGTQLTGSSIPTIVGSSTAGLSRRTAVEQPDSDAITKVDSGPSWENYQFGGPTPIPKPADNELNKEDLLSKFQAARHKSTSSERSRRSTDNTAAIIDALRQVEPHAAEVGGLDGNLTSNDLHLVDSNNQPLATARLRARHKAIQRQLRFVFVYPIVYLAMWVIPFVQHCLNYSDSYSRHPAFGLSCLTTIVLALQCTVDSLVFSFREKPWRYLNSTDSDSPQTLRAFLTPSSRRNTRLKSTASEGLSNRPEYNNNSSRPLSGLSFYSPNYKSSSGVSKPKADRIAEARQARQRRDAETAAARESRQLRPKQRKKSEARWWEIEGKRRKDSVLLGTDSGDNALALTDTNTSGATVNPSETDQGTSHEVPPTRTRFSSREGFDGSEVDEGSLGEPSRGMSTVPEGDEDQTDRSTGARVTEEAHPVPSASHSLSVPAHIKTAPTNHELESHDGSQEFMDARSGDTPEKGGGCG